MQPCWQCAQYSSTKYSEYTILNTPTYFLIPDAKRVLEQCIIHSEFYCVYCTLIKCTLITRDQGTVYVLYLWNLFPRNNFKSARLLSYEVL